MTVTAPNASNSTNDRTEAITDLQNPCSVGR